MAKKHQLLSRGNLLSLAAAIAITIICFAAFSQASDILKDYGYAGIFAISLISSATVFLPMPGFAVVFAASAYLNPVLLGVAAGLGSGIGELTGYLAGYAGHDAIMRTKLFRQHKNGIEKGGPLAVFALAFFPNPIFDIAGVASGAIRMPVWKFLIAAIAGKILRYVIFAYASGYALSQFW